MKPIRQYIRSLVRVADYFMLETRYRIFARFSQHVGVRCQERQPPLIVSLTTIPERLSTVHLCIETLLRQSTMPDKIILWLLESNSTDCPIVSRETLPNSLTRLQTRGLEIRWCENIGSYRKIIPTLKAFPDALVVTADDDFFYDPHWLRDLFEAYQREPQYLHCHVAHLITMQNNKLAPYLNWDLLSKGYVGPSAMLFSTSGGGALYAPGHLHPEVLNKAVFLRLCPKAEDIWLKAMLLKAGVRCKKVRPYSRSIQEIRNRKSSKLQDFNWSDVGKGKSQNDVQLQGVFDNYQLWDQLPANELAESRHGRWMGEDFEPGLVSVIVTTYNQARLLVESIDSVRAQMYRPVELLVIDDGSSDDTRNVVEEWKRTHSDNEAFTIRYLHQDNAGAPAARNFGLIESRGEFIQFHDSDDLLPPERLTTVIRAMEESGAQYCYTGIERFCPETGKVTETHVPSETADPLIECLYNRMCIGTSLFTYRRSFCLNLGPWDESLIVYQDYDQGIRVVTSGERHIAIPKPLVSIRYAGKSGVSEHRLSKKGYECRIRCLSRLCHMVKPMDISEDAKRALITRLYGLGVILYGKGFDDLGRRAGQLGERMGLEPAGSTGIRMRKIWRMGRLASHLYCLGSSVKFRLLKILGRGIKPFRSDVNANV